jgi:hypothetical protein
LKHVAPTTLFMSYFIHMHALLKYDSYISCVPSVSTFLALVHCWLWIDMLRLAVFHLILFYLVDNL